MLSEQGPPDARLTWGEVIQEIYVLEKSLGHQSIVQLVDVFNSKVPHLVFEYVGEDLSKVLQRGGALGPDNVRHCILDLAGALDFVHSLGLLHGDLKPQNILCHWRGPALQLKLADFGSVVLVPYPSKGTCFGNQICGAIWALYYAGRYGAVLHQLRSYHAMAVCCVTVQRVRSQFRIPEYSTVQ